MRQLCLKEIQDKEIIFNLCPSEALSTPVILDGTVKEGSTRIHFKPDNYYTNYSLWCGGDYQPSFRWILACVCASWGQSSAVEQLFHSLFPLQIFDLLSCLQSVRLEEGGKNSQKLLIAKQKNTQGFTICSASTISLAKKVWIKQVAQFLLSCLMDLLGVVAMSPCVIVRHYFS